MPSFRLKISVTQRGMIFDTAASKAAAQAMVIAINDALAVEAVKRIKARLKQVLKNPSGSYESRITVDRSTNTRAATDQGVIYGGWLEGVTSRNQATRFKGYATFRMVKQSIEQDKAKLAQAAVNDFIRLMNEG